jgi:hypothetical protein
MLRVLTAYLAAVLVTYAGAAVAHTQLVMARLADMGVDVTAGDRLGATVHDLGGMAPLFLPMVAVALAVGFLIARAVVRWLPRWRSASYVLAGAVAVVTIHVALSQAFSITPVAGARGALGLTLQALCGALGGWVFLACLPRREPRLAGSTA